MRGLRARQAWKWMAKLMPDNSMNTLQIIKINGLSKKPMLASWVEKPPMATVEKAWQIASKGVIPASQ